MKHGLSRAGRSAGAVACQVARQAACHLPYASTGIGGAPEEAHGYGCLIPMAFYSLGFDLSVSSRAAPEAGQRLVAGALERVLQVLGCGATSAPRQLHVPHTAPVPQKWMQQEETFHLPTSNVPQEICTRHVQVSPTMRCCNQARLASRICHCRQQRRHSQPLVAGGLAQRPHARQECNIVEATQTSGRACAHGREGRGGCRGPPI